MARCGVHVLVHHLLLALDTVLTINTDGLYERPSGSVSSDSLAIAVGSSGGGSVTVQASISQMLIGRECRAMCLCLRRRPLHDDPLVPSLKNALQIVTA